eukprot:m.44642 g.44642  ORF g.44642 m.44642 type:complete len:309 (-) comp10846_c0_seq2:296-1222(-)
MHSTLNLDHFSGLPLVEKYKMDSEFQKARAKFAQEEDHALAHRLQGEFWHEKKEFNQVSHRIRRQDTVVAKKTEAELKEEYLAQQAEQARLDQEYVQSLLQQEQERAQKLFEAEQRDEIVAAEIAVQLESESVSADAELVKADEELARRLSQQHVSKPPQNTKHDEAMARRLQMEAAAIDALQRDAESADAEYAKRLQDELEADASPSAAVGDARAMEDEKLARQLQAMEEKMAQPSAEIMNDADIARQLQEKEMLIAQKRKELRARKQKEADAALAAQSGLSSSQISAETTDVLEPAKDSETFGFET